MKTGRRMMTGNISDHQAIRGRHTFEHIHASKAHGWAFWANMEVRGARVWENACTGPLRDPNATHVPWPPPKIDNHQRDQFQFARNRVGVFAQLLTWRSTSASIFGVLPRRWLWFTRGGRTQWSFPFRHAERLTRLRRMVSRSQTMTSRRVIQTSPQDQSFFFCMSWIRCVRDGSSRSCSTSFNFSLPGLPGANPSP